MRKALRPVLWLLLILSLMGQALPALGAFGIIVREGLEAILVIAAIIAYLVKSGNGKSLKNVYIGALAGILASFAAAAVLYFVKQAVAGAGMAQELIEGVTALASEYEMKLTLGPATYLLSILLTFGVSLIVGLMVARKNRSIDMVAALKTEE